MKLPCCTCKYKKERHEGHRIFVGCVDQKRKEENFIADNYWYDHKCRAYEKEGEIGYENF